MSGSFSRAPAKENGDLVEMPPGWRFRASVRADDIFVYCLSSPPTGPRPKEAGTKACSLRFWSGFAYLSPSQASMLNCPRNRDCRGSEQTPRPLRRGFFFSQMVRLRVEPGRSGVRYLPGLEPFCRHTHQLQPRYPLAGFFLLAGLADLGLIPRLGPF
jgi:hypothetical protein